MLLATTSTASPTTTTLLVHVNPEDVTKIFSNLYILTTIRIVLGDFEKDIVRVSETIRHQPSIPKSVTSSSYVQ